ncbi:uncharacterized protein AB9X84_017501 [Acanthopagrus schlegelii]
MSSVECLRGFISERLTAAAEEIFGVFQKTIVEYEEEIDRQRKLLDIFWKPEIKLHRIELPQQRVCTKDEVLTDQLLCNQERNSSLDREEPEPPQIKEEQEELCSSQDGEQLVLKQETDTSMLIPPYEESGHSGPEQPNSDHQLLPHNSHVAESQNQKGGKHGDSRLTTAAEPEPNKRLKRHRGENPYKCDTCGINFKYNNDFNLHMRVHTGKKSFSCNTCGRDFRTSSNMIRHMRVHTGEKPYICNTCGRAFRQNHILLDHMRVHTGEKPFSCKTCGKDFRSSSNMIRHMRVHTGEKPYICNTCGKGFRHSQYLLGHMRIHTGEKPYICPTCGKKFSWLSQMKRHLRIHLM